MTSPKIALAVLKATSGVIENLLFLSPTRHLLYVSDIEHGRLTGKFEHLACFFPGLLALAAATLDLSKSDHELYMWAAEGLAHSCWIMYADQESGLGPELVRMDMWPGDSRRGRWVDHVDEWQRVGRPGNKPPGVRDLAPPVKAGEHKDYILEVGTYFSRPEVPFYIFRLSFMADLAVLCLDAGKYVCDVAHDRRYQVARTRLGDLGCYREQDPHV